MSTFVPKQHSQYLHPIKAGRQGDFLVLNSLFESQVRDRGVWNLKYREGDVNHWERTLGITFWGYETQMRLHGTFVTVEDLGNITYGYLGAATGFDQSWLNFWSGANHTKNHGVTQWENELADQARIGRGINWYNSGW